MTEALRLNWNSLGDCLLPSSPSGMPINLVLAPPVESDSSHRISSVFKSLSSLSSSPKLYFCSYLQHRLFCLPSHLPNFHCFLIYSSNLLSASAAEFLFGSFFTIPVFLVKDSHLLILLLRLLYHLSEFSYSLLNFLTTAILNSSSIRSHYSMYLCFGCWKIVIFFL